MRVIAVDDEVFALRDLKEAIMQAIPDCEPDCFSSPADALRYAEESRVDVAFLDIEMSGMNGLALAKHLKDLNPKTNIVFVTGYRDYSCDAFTLRASGYILKPVKAGEIQSEIENLRYVRADKAEGRLKVQCFGNFEVFWEEKPLNFSRKKTKELFAYLVSHRGAGCTNGEIAAVLWEDFPDSDSLQSNLRNLVSDLSAVLKSVGAEDVLIKSRGSLAVAADRLDCDYYQFYRGEARAVNSYAGEFMSQYSWAEFAIGNLNRRAEEKEEKQ